MKPLPLRRAESVVEFLIDNGPSTTADICEGLGLTKSQVTSAIAYARSHLLVGMGMVIPAPTPADGWAYQVTTEWEPVERGMNHSLASAEARMLSVLRDVQTIKPHLQRGTKESRRANFIEKHLTHITSTLAEIQ